MATKVTIIVLHLYLISFFFFISPTLAIFWNPPSYYRGIQGNPSPRSSKNMGAPSLPSGPWPPNTNTNTPPVNNMGPPSFPYGPPNTYTNTPPVNNVPSGCSVQMSGDCSQGNTNSCIRHVRCIQHSSTRTSSCNAQINGNCNQQSCIKEVNCIGNNCSVRNSCP
ncbi:hypothetical protein CTI12_AA201760 [Artemisia annua]|uniref:Uncharacterized protein n=1 Tax=Artemisia annua TaxID=35608 RepID=A0A2U1NUN7_ARTAN|nr:hypothetical protein CTI12_AA201760 [Artemisia annua]